MAGWNIKFGTYAVVGHVVPVEADLSDEKAGSKGASNRFTLPLLYCGYNGSAFWDSGVQMLLRNFSWLTVTFGHFFWSELPIKNSIVIFCLPIASALAMA